MRLADNETQTSETKCTEVCWTNYTRRVFMVMVGIGIYFGSITLTFIMTPLFVFMSILEFKYIEEPELEKRFGKEYREYKGRTPIIIPKIR